MSTKTAFKRVALVAAAALAIGGFTAVSANAAITAGTQTLGAISQSVGVINGVTSAAWTQPVTFSVTSGTALVAGGTVAITEANSGTSAATATVPTYTLLAADIAAGGLTATFSTTITYTAGANTTASFTTAITGTTILTPTIGGFAGAASASATLPGNPNLEVTVASTNKGNAGTQIAGPANSVSILNINGASAIYFTVTGGLTTAGAASGTVALGGAALINIATPTIGTITVTGYVINGATGTASATASDVVTITVTGALPGTVYAATAVLGASGATTPTSGTDSAFSVISPAAAGTQAANWTAQENDASGGALTVGFKALAISSTLGTLAVSGGVGTITAAGGYATGTPTGAFAFTLTSNGQAGTATVNLSVNGVSVKTYSVVFSGVAAKIVLTAVNPVVAVGVPATLLAATNSITANTNALEVQEFDAAGNLVSVNPAITLTSGSTATATASSPSVAVGLLPVNFLAGDTAGTALSTTVGGVSVTGVAAGTTTFTATDGTLVSAPVTVRVSSATPTIVVFSTNAASYGAGQGGSLVTTISDAGGTLPAGSYAILTGAATSAYALAVGVLPGTTVAGVVKVNDAGVNTVAFNAPLSDGTNTITGTAAATTIAITPAVFTVTSGSSDASNAATDAANEATDAANAATDAANAAADSADAATQAAQDAGDKADAALAAVTALSQQVTTLLAKVAAVTATLAKISAAIAKLPKK